LPRSVNKARKERVLQGFLQIPRPLPMRDLKKASAKLSILGDERIRKTFADGEWWFAVPDVVAVLAGTEAAEEYLGHLKAQMKYEGGAGLARFMRDFPAATQGGEEGVRHVNTRGLFRVAQFVVSPQAGKIKRWLADTGYEYLQELEDPELATRRIWRLYRSRGYGDHWIRKRLEGIAIREELTDEWHDRGVTEGEDFKKLTEEVSRATFGLIPSEYKQMKHLPEQENLRDHMTDTELIFSLLGEAATVEIVRRQDAQGVERNMRAAREGGEVAGQARQMLESRTGSPIVSEENFFRENGS
jgi:DNA-damage-inducible protein D